MATLPETLVETIKNLVKAHEAFAHDVEELQALSLAIQGNIDRLVQRQHRLADLHLGDKTPVTLPRGITPHEAAAE